MNAQHEETYKGLTIKIYQDDDSGSDGPRDWDNLGTMVCWHRRYNLGDKHDHADADAFRRSLAIEADPNIETTLEYWEDRGDDDKAAAAISRTLDKHVFILPLYLYDHSGITISTGPFSCPWDSGQVGYIYMTKDKYRREFERKRLPAASAKTAYEILEQEAKTYDQFLTGDVWGFIIEDKHESHLDSCWNFYGFNACLQEARDSANWHADDQEKKRRTELTDLISRAAYRARREIIQSNVLSA